ncbi:MAG: DinB family protein [Ardenticatenaceae bacterium]|nr:DinB family protein [Ardenticatenaceae bacterium]
MTENILARLIEHNNWATLQIFDVCATLTAAQLDFEPQSAVRGTIRETLRHLVLSQEDYTAMLTTFDHPPEREVMPTLVELREIVVQSGRELVALVQDFSSKSLQSQIQVSDGYRVEPWVFIVQAINHATEHREQIKSILSALGVEPPRIDGWMYGRLENALIPPGS